MAINALRNKRYGPGGGTRRLHHYGGEFRIDMRSKGMVFARRSPTVIGLNLVVANDNYAEARLAA